MIVNILAAFTVVVEGTSGVIACSSVVACCVLYLGLKFFKSLFTIPSGSREHLNLVSSLDERPFVDDGHSHRVSENQAIVAG